MATTLRLTTLAQVKQYLRLKPPAAAGATVAASIDSADDALLETFIDAASEAIANCCGREFSRATYSERRNGSGTCKLVLAVYPVISVTRVALVTAPRTSASGTDTTQELVADVDYGCSPLGTLERYGGNIFWRGQRNVIVEYVAGYSSPPSDLARVAAAWCALRYRELERIGQSSKSMGGEVVQFDAAMLSKADMDIVQQYKARTPVGTAPLVTPL